MNNAKAVFEDYLEKIGQLDPIQLGSENRRVTNDDSAFIISRLQNQLKYNNTIIMLTIVMLTIIFIIDVFLVFYSLKNPTVVKAAFSGTFTISSLYGVIRWMRKLWIEKSLMDVTLAMAQNLPPEQAATFISATYWNILDKDNNPSPH